MSSASETAWGNPMQGASMLGEPASAPAGTWHSEISCSLQGPRSATLTKRSRMVTHQADSPQGEGAGSAGSSHPYTGQDSYGTMLAAASSYGGREAGAGGTLELDGPGCYSTASARSFKLQKMVQPFVGQPQAAEPSATADQGLWVANAGDDWLSPLEMPTEAHMEPISCPAIMPSILTTTRAGAGMPEAVLSCDQLQAQQWRQQLQFPTGLKLPSEPVLRVSVQQQMQLNGPQSCQALQAPGAMPQLLAKPPQPQLLDLSDAATAWPPAASALYNGSAFSSPKALVATTAAAAAQPLSGVNEAGLVCSWHEDMADWLMGSGPMPMVDSRSDCKPGRTSTLGSAEMLAIPDALPETHSNSIQQHVAPAQTAAAQGDQRTAHWMPNLGQQSVPQTAAGGMWSTFAMPPNANGPHSSQACSSTLGNRSHMGPASEPAPAFNFGRGPATGPYAPSGGAGFCAPADTLGRAGVLGGGMTMSQAAPSMLATVSGDLSSRASTSLTPGFIRMNLNSLGAADALSMPPPATTTRPLPGGSMLDTRAKAGRTAPDMIPTPTGAVDSALMPPPPPHQPRARHQHGAGIMSEPSLPLHGTRTGHAGHADPLSGGSAAGLGSVGAGTAGLGEARPELQRRPSKRRTTTGGGEESREVVQALAMHFEGMRQLQAQQTEMAARQQQILDALNAQLLQLARK